MGKHDNKASAASQNRVQATLASFKGSKSARIARDAAILSVFVAGALVAGVGMLHDVFTVPQHTIGFDEAMVGAIPVSLCAVVARDILLRDENLDR